MSFADRAIYTKGDYNNNYKFESFGTLFKYSTRNRIITSLNRRSALYRAARIKLAPHTYPPAVSASALQPKASRAQCGGSAYNHSQILRKIHTLASRPATNRMLGVARMNNCRWRVTIFGSERARFAVAFGSIIYHSSSFM